MHLQWKKPTMLNAHFAQCERVLLATSQIPANSGHSLHKGTPRESFIAKFLNSHLSERVSVGTGEVIDSDSKPDESRNQLDIVIYKREYPKLDFGGGVSAFLAESLVSTIEVKSTLTKDDLSTAIVAARRIKSLSRHERGMVLSYGYQPPGPFCFVVAYDGPKNMTTVHGWVADIAAKQSICFPEMPPTGEARNQVLCPIVDGIFILGRGFVMFDNMPNSFVNDELRQTHPNLKWCIADMSEGALLVLFLQLTSAIGAVSVTAINPIPYLSSFNIPRENFRVGE